MFNGLILLANCAKIKAVRMARGLYKSYLVEYLADPHHLLVFCLYAGNGLLVSLSVASNMLSLPQSESVSTLVVMLLLLLTLSLADSILTDWNF